MKKIIGRFTNSINQTVAANGNILFTNNTFSDNNAFGYNSNGQIQIKVPGTYMIYSNFLGIATGAGDVLVQMYENNTAVSSAFSAGTAAASGDYLPMNFNAVATVRISNPGSYATLNFTSSEATSITNANVIIEKII